MERREYVPFAVNKSPDQEQGLPRLMKPFETMSESFPDSVQKLKSSPRDLLGKILKH